MRLLLVRLTVLYLVAAGSLGCRSAGASRERIAARGETPPTGYWQDTSEERRIIYLDSRRRIDFFGNRIGEMGRILGIGDGEMRLCVYGRDVLGRFEVIDGLLHLQDPTSTEIVLRQLPGKPIGLETEALELPSPSQLSSEAVEEIQREIRRRFREDAQAEREVFGAEIGSSKPHIPTDPLARFRRIDITSRNRDYLSSLITRIGWIDAKRFGYATSHAAMLLVQHSGDRLLLESVLPWIKRDVEAGIMNGSAYALVYDRLHLALGEKQLFATQIGRDENDFPLIYPTEEPDRVEDRRKKLGLIPLGEYIKLFGGTEVRFSSACSTGT